MFNLTSILFLVLKNFTKRDGMSIEFDLSLSRTTSRGFDEIFLIGYLYLFSCHIRA